MISTATPFVLRMHEGSFQRDGREHDPRSRTSFPSTRHEHGRHAAPATGNRALEPLNYSTGGRYGFDGGGKSEWHAGVLFTR